MRTIKVKERDRTPRIRDGSARLPKELMKKSLIRTQEKMKGIYGRQEKTEADTSPNEYAVQKIRTAEEYLLSNAGNVGRQTFTSGKQAAKKVSEKIRERKQADARAEFWQEEQADLKAAEQGKARDAYASRDMAGQKKESLITRRDSDEGRQTAKHPEYSNKTEKRKPDNRIKTKPERTATVYRQKHQTIKVAPKAVGSAGYGIYPKKSASKRYVNISAGSIRSAAELTRKQAVKAKATERMAQQYVKQNIQMAKRTTGTARKLLEVIEKAFHAAKAVGMLAGLIGGMAMMVLIVIVGILGGILFSSTSQSTLPLSEEVLSYTPLIEKYANEYGIGEYVQVIQAIMMQESAGRGTDPMQCSECPYNTQYPNTPGAITDPEYSIQVGIRYYKDCIEEAGCSGPQDMEKLKLSLQGYNYGNGYISWAVRNYGGYSEANALQFSQEQAASHGWERYGDPEYVPHVLRYYSSGNIFAGLFGNGQMVSVALSQLGNSGGQKFWSWYGFDSYVSWCACFASWCGDQCGLIESGAMPKFSYCDDAITWFKTKNKWQGRNHTPSAGTLIFFDWLENGVRDGVSDHVGIVEKCEDGVVYTVEGNSSNAVRQRSYTVGDASIMGYGILGN